jgi:hypothetical protein
MNCKAPPCPSVLTAGQLLSSRAALSAATGKRWGRPATARRPALAALHAFSWTRTPAALRADLSSGARFDAARQQLARIGNAACVRVRRLEA